MRILVDIGHPGDVHVFAAPIRRWEARGHQVRIVSSDKDVALSLLDAYGLPYDLVGTREPGLLKLAALVVTRTWRIMQIARRFKPDVYISIGSPTAALASAVRRKPHIAFNDSEFSRLQYRVMAPFTEAVCTPRAFLRDLGPRQHRYRGYKELAYLHPNVFTPDPAVAARLGIAPDEEVFVVRYVAWMATHDVGQHGLSDATKRTILEELQARGRVILSVEGAPPTDLSQPDVPIAADDFLHLLAQATLCIGEGLTTATEAALLGTPAILVTTLQAGNFYELRDRYGLVAYTADESEALDTLRAWLANPQLKAEWLAKRDAMLADCDDVTAWITEFVEAFVERGQKTN